jgi:hypothetical protein
MDIYHTPATIENAIHFVETCEKKKCDDAILHALRAIFQYLPNTIYSAMQQKQHNPPLQLAGPWGLPLMPSISKNGRVSLFHAYITPDYERTHIVIVKACVKGTADLMHQEAFVMREIGRTIDLLELAQLQGGETSHIKREMFMSVERIFVSTYDGNDLLHIPPNMHVASRVPCTLSLAVRDPCLIDDLVSHYYERQISLKDTTFFHCLSDFITNVYNMHALNGFIHNDMHFGNVIWDNTNKCFTLIDYGRAYINHREEIRCQKVFQHIKDVYSHADIYPQHMLNNMTLTEMFEHMQGRFTKSDDYAIFADLGGLLLILMYYKNENISFQADLSLWLGNAVLPFHFDFTQIIVTEKAIHEFWATKEPLKMCLAWVGAAIFIFANKLNPSTAQVIVNPQKDMPYYGLFPKNGVMLPETYAIYNNDIRLYLDKRYNGITSRFVKSGGRHYGGHRGGQRVGKQELQAPSLQEMMNLKTPDKSNIETKWEYIMWRKSLFDTDYQEITDYVDGKFMNTLCPKATNDGIKIQPFCRTPQNDNIGHTSRMEVPAVGGDQNRVKATYIRFRDSGDSPHNSRTTRKVYKNEQGEKYVIIDKKRVLLKDIRGRYTYVK